MKTTAIIDLGFMNPEYFKEYFREIRENELCDNLIVIAAGDFKRNGTFTSFDFESRFEALKNAGADLIIRHPTICTCLRNPYFNFSLTSFINKLRAIDTLVLPFADDTPKSLEFAEKFQSDLKFSYSSVQCIFKHIPDGVLSDTSDSVSKDRVLMDRIKEFFACRNKDYMMEIFGGTEALIDHLLERIDIINSNDTYTEAAEKLSNVMHSPEKIRQFLLRCVINFRKLDHSICALYEYSSYSHIVFERKDYTAVTDLITKNGYIQQIWSENAETDFLKDLNPSKQNLYRINDFLYKMFS